jgi:NADH-quinone oxidoreductase subunit C/D
MPNTELLRVIQTRFPDSRITPEETRDNILTIWVPGKWILEVLQYLKNEINKPFRMLYDLTGIDMRAYNRQGLPPEFPFVVVYQLLSFDRNSHIKIKVGLKGDSPEVPSITGIWRNANWYEREAWDMFGIRFNGHPHLTRLLMPHYWEGHPLRKDHPARATEMGLYHLPDDKMEKEEKGRKYHRVERSYGKFERDFTLPDDADASKLAAEFKDGVLKVHMPKSPAAKPKAIEIKVQ